MTNQCLRRGIASFLFMAVFMAVFMAACGGAPAKPEPASEPSGAPAEPAALVAPGEVHFADLRQLTFAGENAEAYWAWDGSQLILQHSGAWADPKRPANECDQIFELPVDNGVGDPRLVSTGNGRTTCSYFFPGNRHILYSSTHAAGAACPPKPGHELGYVWPLYDSYDIYTAQADGSDLRNISHSPGYDAEATVCGGDGSIVFTSTRDGDIELYRMDADGGNVRRLTHTPGYDGGAFFSPDCSRIVWRASRPHPGPELDDFKALLARGLVRPTKLELWVMNADGSDQRQITYLDAASFGPSWFPSGDRLLFATNLGDPKGREFDIWAVNPNGTGLERITHAPGFDGFPLLSPDGKRLAFSSNRHGKVLGETDVYVASWLDHPQGAKLEERGADRFYADVAWLADDAREGRGVGTAGLDAAADWLERRYKDLGLEPAGKDGYRQAFQVTTGIRAGAGTALAVDGKALPADAFSPVGFSAPGAVAADVVYAGYGISAPELGQDDYKNLKVKGKIVLVRRFAPEGGKFEMHAVRRYSDPRYKAWNAREHGAKAILFADLNDKTEEHHLPAMTVDNIGDAGIPSMWLARGAAAPLVAGKHKAELTIVLDAKRTPAYDMVARVPAGAAQKLPGVVVIGAHYDHLGFGGPASLAPGVHAVHHGADDNASGTAALLEAARALMARRQELRRDVILVAFSGEEMGDVGSTAFVREPPPSLGGSVKDGVVAMLNLDMVGRMHDNELQVIGVDTATEWKGLVEPACALARIRCAEGTGGYGPSDHTPFYAAGVPVLFFFTGVHRDYHKPTDEVSQINAAGGAQVALLVAELAAAVSAHEGRLSYAASPAPDPMGDLRNTGASLGTVPDYVGSPDGTAGLLLAGVRPGGPAEAAGLRRGDIILSIDGHPVKNAQDLMFVLDGAKPGAKAKVVFLREGKKQETVATYGKPAHF